MKCFISLLLFSLIITVLQAQNVGIGTLTPTEKLDVNGNIDIRGTIKANGSAGQTGQVLMSTGSGLSWGSTAGYRKSKSYSFSGSFTFTVPAGVTEVMAEAWGAGSGGTINCGGTSGGYARTVRSVNPGDVLSLTVGVGSSLGSVTTLNGDNSTVTFGSDVLTAFGGGGITSTNGRGLPRNGSATGGLDNAYFLYGSAGKATTSTGFLSNATTYVEIIEFGAGGIPSGFLNPVALDGDHLRLENGVVTNTVYGQNSKFAGAGGPAGTGSGGWNGANGFITIWWN